MIIRIIGFEAELRSYIYELLSVFLLLLTYKHISSYYVYEYSNNINKYDYNYDKDYDNEIQFTNI